MMLAVVDYGMGNLGSLTRTLEAVGAAARVVENPGQVAAADAIILPGVGAFSEGMRQLHQRGWTDTLRAFVAQNRPLLGICLGMQLLADEGCEGENTAGLGIIPGTVVRMNTDVSGERLPHVGWNEVHPNRTSPLFEGIPGGADFYFVHSYHFIPGRNEDALSYTPYCGGFVSSVAKGNVFGVQFHPEKSSQLGRQLLKNFVTRVC